MKINFSLVNNTYDYVNRMVEEQIVKLTQINLRKQGPNTYQQTK